jgi:hypothetical protein
MQKSGSLDTPFDRKTDCGYKIWEEFPDSESLSQNYDPDSPIYLPRYSSASRNSQSASMKCQ